MTDAFISYSTSGGGVPKYSTFSALPATPSDGDLAIVTDTDTLYGYNGTAWVVVGVAGSTVVAVSDTSTVDLTNTSGTLSAAIVSGSITNSLVSPTAAIDATKIANGSVSNTEFQYLDGVTGAIQTQLDSKVNDTGDAMTGNLTMASSTGIESTSPGSSLNVGTTSNTSTLNLGTGAHTNTVNIATGSGVTNINIGGAGDTVSVAGTLAVIDTINLEVQDKTITTNKGGLSSSGFSAGLEVEEAGSVTGWVRTTADRSGWDIKSPSSGSPVTVKSPTGSASMTLDAAGVSGSDKSLVIPNVSGTFVTTGDTGTVTSTMIADNTIVDADINASAAISLSKLATGALPSGITVDSSNIVDGSIVDADISASAAIGLSKLATGALPSGITVDSSNIVNDSIVDADINSAAAIARSKLASGTANHVLINNGSGVMSSESALAVTRGGTGLSAFTTGDILYTSGTNTLAALPIGSANNVLTVVGGIPSWQPGLSDPMTTAGDMIIRNGSNITARLPLGANNTVLTSNGTIPTYAQVTSAMIADETIVNADIAPGAAIDGSKIVEASASVPGVVSTGTQTLAGNKTFSGIVAVTNGTASTSASTGALQLAGGMGIAGQMNITGDIRIGSNRGSDGSAVLNFQAVSGAATSNASVSRGGGANGDLNIIQTGTGNINLTRGATSHVVADANGTAVFGRTAGVTLGSGFVGEIINTFASGSAALSSPSTYTTIITSTTLPVGIWLVSAQCFFANNSGSTTTLNCTLLYGADPEDFSFSQVPNIPTGSNLVLNIAARTIVSNGTDALVLRARSTVGSASITAGNNNFSSIRAVRIA